MSPHFHEKIDTYVKKSVKNGIGGDKDRKADARKDKRMEKKFR